MNIINEKMLELANALRKLGGDKCLEASQIVLHSADSKDMPQHGVTIDRAVSMLTDAVDSGDCNLLGSNRVAAMIDDIKGSIKG